MADDSLMSTVTRSVFWVLIAQLMCGSATPILNKIKPESLQLVKEIKANLRKNNDDYVEGTSRVASPTDNNLARVTPKLINTVVNASHGSNGQEDKKPKEADVYHRRAHHAPDLTDKTFPKLTPVVKPDSETATKPTDGVLLFRSFTKYPNVKPMPKKYLRKDKLKRFIERNRGSLQQMQTGKRAELLTRAGEDWGASGGLQGKVEVPSGAQLDLAPAKGSRIEKLRIKGRLCQRHVLVPEGPKYDSGGRVYLPELRGRRYGNTRAPDLLLPRCCNCCRKSVLGCE